MASLPRTAAAGVAVAAAAIAFASGMARIGKLLLIAPAGQGRGELLSSMTYNLTVLSANYVQLGAVRRGMGGTIAALLGRDFLVRGVAFHALSLVLLLIPLGIMMARLFRSAGAMAAGYMAAFLVLSPQTFISWRVDPARTDMMAYSFVAWGALMATRQRWVAAAAIVALGSLVHEVSPIYGAPLLVGMAVRRGREGTLDRRRARAGATVFAATFLLVMLVPLAIGPAPGTTAAVMRANSPAATTPQLLDLQNTAIYMLVTGTRGLAVSMCSNWVSSTYPLMLALSIVILLAAAVALGLLPNGGTIAALACVAPLVLMNLIATDVGRWLALAVVQAWLLSADAQLGGTTLRPVRIVAGSAILAALLAMGRTSSRELNPIVAKFPAQLGFPPPLTFEQLWQACDPDWRKRLSA